MFFSFYFLLGKISSVYLHSCKYCSLIHDLDQIEAKYTLPCSWIYPSYLIFVLANRRKEGSTLTSPQIPNNFLTTHIHISLFLSTKVTSFSTWSICYTFITPSLLSTCKTVLFEEICTMTQKVGFYLYKNVGRGDK